MARKSNGNKAVRYNNRIITRLQKVCPARKGTKRLRAMQMLQATRNTTIAIPKLKKMGADTSFIRHAVERGYIRLSKQQSA